MVGCYYNHADKESALNECSPLSSHQCILSPYIIINREKVPFRDLFISVVE